MAGKRLAVFDPSGRLLDELAAAARTAGVALVVLDPKQPAGDVAAIVLPPAAAVDLGPAVDGSPPRWIVGDASSAARVAGAAATAHAAGALLAPVAPSALVAIAQHETTSLDLDIARARGLIATSLVDLTGSATDALRALADGFASHDCIVWWKDGAQMTPTTAREYPEPTYRAQIAAAARIAAAASGTVMVGAPDPRSVIADALRTSPTEVAGLVAIVSDTGRRFSTGERTDLKAVATRLSRELSWLASHRRLVADGERLAATSLHDPLTGAMTRGAFEQSLAHEIAAGARRGEKLSLVLLDIGGLRRINLAHGHAAGDEVLSQIASRLRATVRGNDPLGRPGGDELAVLLVGAAAEQAALVARKLITNVQSDLIHVDGDNELAVQVRAVVTEIAPGERSGEAALARCYGKLRNAPLGEVVTVDSADRSGDADSGAETALAAGTIVGGTYRVVHELSRGAMGVVYRGEDLGLNRSVAIKVLRSDLASDKELVERFRAEAGILASLHHKNLVQVYTLGEHAGDVYFVMELVEGQPLSELLRALLERGEWFPTDSAAQIVLEIGDALDAMHALGLIHRDVKPANVLIDRERDRAVLVDVGVAMKAGDARDAAGTPGFAAPESFLEQQSGPATDVYGLAATMYCLLVGRPPFGSGSALQVVQRQLSDAVPPPSTLRSGLSDAVDAVLIKALAPQPKKRYPSASAFAIALNRALERGEKGSDIAIALPRVDSRELAAASAVLEPTEGITLDPLPSVKPGGQIVGRVRAAHLRVLSRILQHQLGSGAIAKITLERPELARALSPTLAPLAWSELADLVAALAHAQQVMPNGLVPRKVARGTMSATFARLFGADPSSLPAETVLAALPTFWTRYHDWGDVEVVVETGAADVTLRGYSGSTDVCVLVGAQLERIVELTGGKAASALHERCRCTGDDACHYRLSWTSP
jgi:diguanylate cyclase (GGDEF)-like protein